MSYILCRWLNTELRLSQVVGPKTFARDFSNGYLIGEILQKYDLQTDFDMFSKDDNKSSKANNFSRLKPTLQMIGISLDETTVQELMEVKQSVALHLIYTLYVALKNKNKIIGGSLESFMSKASSAYRHKKEQDLYSEVCVVIQLYFFLSNPCSNFCLEEPKSEAVYIKDIESKQCLNSEYIEQIRQRLKEDAFTQKQRERRAVQFVVEKSKAQKAEQDAQIEESLVKHLTRQTKMEKRLVSQLLQIRSQKEMLIKNNLPRQQQFQQRREKDFEEALDREAALARQERLEHAAEVQRNLDMCNKLVAERKQKKNMKHFSICKEILEQIVDLATKAGDYHLLNSSIIPEKQMKEWKEFLLCGLPLYETVHEEEDNMQLNPVELLKQDELNKLDYEEYEVWISYSILN
uniref:Calponin-homology (CH) domain-containing protein n=1 Tax=Periophthalmus magnuspinnatus TaxID=409849 RepID=A0A3B3ZGQ2_9GOBI